MNKKKESLKMVERIAKIKVDNNRFGWPPLCMGMLHQPKRPVNNSLKNKN